ncbi:hypothetical protein JW960_20660 [candidate division KSB1 bacterium]|nr:hypothetical protein [candidate division KSB1 bacterium]
MVTDKEMRSHILSLVLLSLGGLLLHVRAHPPSSNPANYAPAIFGIVNVLVVPFLLMSKRMWLIGYLINGFGATFGIVLMGASSLTALPFPLTVSSLFLRTLLPDIFLLIPKLFIAQRILYYYKASGTGRLFTAWWWTRHIGYVMIIYTIGHFVWR